MEHSLTHYQTTMSQEQAEQDDEAELRKRVRELIDEERELYDSLA